VPVPFILYSASSSIFFFTVSTALKNVHDNNLVEKVGKEGITGIWRIKENLLHSLEFNHFFFKGIILIYN